MSLVSNKMKNFPSSPTLAVAQKVRQLKSKAIKIFDLGVGELSKITPVEIQNAASLAMQSGHTKYTRSDGPDNLKEAIIRKFKKFSNLHFNKNQITVGAGAKQVLFNIFFALLNNDDELITPVPFWASYEIMVSIANARFRPIQTKYENYFKLQPDELRSAINDKTKILLLNSPCNPSGAVYTENELRDIIKVIKDYPNIVIVSDDVYENFVYTNEKFVTPAQIIQEEFPELLKRVITVCSLSKSYAMTGWRVGYAAADPEIISAIFNVQSNMTGNTSSISQEAAIYALDNMDQYLIQQEQEFKEKCDKLTDLLTNIRGLRFHKPEGAFYFWLDINPYLKNMDTNEFCEYLLLKHHIAVVSGDDFGCPGFIRISYGADFEIIEEAIPKLKFALEELL